MIHQLQGAHVEVKAIDGEWATLALGGEFDLDNSRALEQTLVEQFDVGCRTLIVDARDTTFMDSTALAVLLRVHGRCSELGGTLVLAGVHGSVARLIETTGLDQIMRAEP